MKHFIGLFQMYRHNSNDWTMLEGWYYEAIIQLIATCYVVKHQELEREDCVSWSLHLIVGTC